MTHEPGDIMRIISSANQDGKPVCYSYPDAYQTILDQKFPPNSSMIYTAFCSYDTTPRYGKNGCVFQESSPEIFEEYLAKLMAKNAAEKIDLFFIDAWNEWGEGMHLEPDKRYGFRWLEAVKRAKERYENYIEEFTPLKNHMDITEYKLRCNSSKFEMYLNLLSDWMYLYEKKKKISVYLKKYNLGKILIYGYGIFAKHLISECKEEEITIVGVIDKEKTCDVDGIRMYQMNENIPGADGIIVTAYYYMSDICEEIRKYHKDIPIYSISEIIYEMLYL